jgi:hypothetical protein
MASTPATAEWPQRQDFYRCDTYRDGRDWRRWANRNCAHWRRDHDHRRTYRRPIVRYVAPPLQPRVPAPGSQHCPGTVINVVSGERQGEAKAKGDARKLFMGQASARHGLAYAELGYAKLVRWRCFPAQAHDTWTGALAKGGNIVMGGDGQNVRCELWASPCSVPVERE